MWHSVLKPLNIVSQDTVLFLLIWQKKQNMKNLSTSKRSHFQELDDSTLTLSTRLRGPACSVLQHSTMPVHSKVGMSTFIDQPRSRLELSSPLTSQTRISASQLLNTLRYFEVTEKKKLEKKSNFAEFMAQENAAKGPRNVHLEFPGSLRCSAVFCCVADAPQHRPRRRPAAGSDPVVQRTWRQKHDGDRREPRDAATGQVKRIPNGNRKIWKISNDHKIRFLEPNHPSWILPLPLSSRHINATMDPLHISVW